MLILFTNFAVFQIGWFAAVLTAAQNVPAVGVLVMFAAIALHLYLSQEPVIELALVLMCGAIGAIWDSLLVVMGWVDYPSGYIFGGAAPYWIIAMWMLFATTLNVSLRWMRGSYLFAAVLGLVGGPLAYFTGAQLGGIVLVDFTAAMLALGIGWGILMPLLSALAARFDGTKLRPAAGQPLILD